MSNRGRRFGPLLAFAGLCYLPLLATSRGLVVADTKSYLYLDPGRLLSRAWSMWDPQVGMGTVTHQNIGFLWPMGPYYWLMEHAGVPDWAAQRLWLGSIMVAAGLGVRLLLRTIGWRGPGVGVAMCAYALTPYLLTIAPRISAILLPFAALPWMIALAVRAARSGSWRDPALFALVVATAGTSNATAILLAGLGPALWLVWAAIVREHPLRRIAAVTGRIAVLTLGTNAWWIAGLSVQATHGVDVLRYTESVATTAAASSASEVLRGLGYWFFYGDDAMGPWIGPSRPYQTSLWLLAVTFAIPVLALTGAGLTRWRHRSFAVLLLMVGLVLAVGVYPYEAPSPVGRALRAFLQSDVGMAMRSMPRATPLVVLALSIMLGAGAQALARRRPRGALPVAALLIALVVAGLPPLWQRTLVPENLRRPEAIPDYWVDAGQHLDVTDDGTRVLEVPGADFTSYRWGTTIDPVTPGLTDRPVVARELVPMGSAAAWNLLKAFDGRLQANIAEATTVAPIARTMRAGQILVRSDLQYEHYDTPRPRNLWHFLLGAPGLGPATAFGAPIPNVAQAPAPMLDELELSTSPGLRDPFPVTVLPVKGTPPIVAAKPSQVPVVVAGDGEGLVDSAAAGLIDGTELIRYSAAMTDRQLRSAVADGAVLVLTDTNRRRAERWGSIRFTSGYTEPAGVVPLRLDRSDARLPVFPSADDADRTIALHRGGVTANATSYGGRNEYLPEDRPANAVDGDPATAWRAGLNDPVHGERLELTVRRPVTTRTVRFLAPPAPINRWVTRVALRFDGGPAIERDLDARSRQEPGQIVDVGQRTFTRLEIEILEDSAGSRPRYGGLTSTGFAEVRISDLRLDEVIRPPTSLLDRLGPASVANPLAIVLTRLRSAVTDIERQDEERSLVRVVELPDERAFGLTGSARLSPRASDLVLDGVLGQPDATSSATSSSRMGTVASRASSAIDGDLATAWTTAYGEQTGQWIDITSPWAPPIDHLNLAVVADGRHSVPTRVGVEADGRRVASLTLPAIPDSATPGATTRVRLSLPASVRASTLRLVVDAARTIETTDWGTRAVRTLPVAIAEVSAPGIRPFAPRGAFSMELFSSGCRSDLLTVGGATVPVIISGTVADAIAGAPLHLRTCDDGALTIGAGTTDLRAEPGAESGLDLDRIVLRSSGGGTADLSDATLRRASAPPTSSAPALTILRSDPDAVTVRVQGARPGQPFWFTFGQGWSDGWTATSPDLALGAPVLVDGFANGWKIEPAAETFELALRFTPQRRVDLALWGSLMAALGCLALALRRRTPAASRTIGTVREDPDPVSDRHGSPALSVGTALALALILAALGVAVASPWVGAAAGVLALLIGRGPFPRQVTALVAPAAMAASAGYVVLTVTRHHPAPGLEWPAELHRSHPLAWFAVLALVVDAVVMAVRTTRRR